MGNQASDFDPETIAALRTLAAQVVSLWRIVQQSTSHSPAIDSVLGAISNLDVPEDEYPILTGAIRDYIEDAARISSYLKELLTQLETKAAERVRQVRYTEQWWQRKSQKLHRSFQENAQLAFGQWLKLYAETLLAWELESCARLSNEPFLFPAETRGVISAFQKGSQGLLNGDYPGALEMLQFLVDSTPASLEGSHIDDTSRALLLIFMGRIYQIDVADSWAAAAHFEQARALVPSDGRPLAALGHYYLLGDHPDLATKQCSQSIRLSPDQPDGYIAMGLCFELQGLWSDADDQYRKAVELLRQPPDGRDVTVALGKLRTPTSGNAYFQAARVLKQDDPRSALRAVTRAIEIGLKHEAETDYPDRIAYRLQGEILENLDRKTDAAAAYFEAGMRFSGRNEPQFIAIEVLRKARKFDPAHAPTCWYLADSLIRDSLSPPESHPNKNIVGDSLSVWNAGAVISQPGFDYSWAYHTRAIINDQLLDFSDDSQWVLGWEAASYLERALLLNEEDAGRWTYLSRWYRLLRLESNAFQAISKALTLASENPDVQFEFAQVLIGANELSAAQTTIQSYQQMVTEPKPWLDALQAYLLLHQEKYAEALEAVNSALKSAPEYAWYLLLRALCYRGLGEQSLAEKDYHQILNQDPPSNGEAQNYAWAAFSVGQLDRAIETDRPMLEDRAQVGNVLRDIGQYYLARGDPTKDDLSIGREYLEKGIASASPFELRVLALDLKDLVRRSAAWPHGEQVRPLFDMLQERIQARAVDVAQRPSAEWELEHVLAQLPQEAVSSWPWIGAHASLARLDREAKQWKDAAAHYRLLHKAGARFHEARTGLERCIEELKAEGDERLQAADYAEAQEQFRQALALSYESFSDNQRRLADLHVRLGLVSLYLSKNGTAPEHFRQAIEHYRADGSLDPGPTLGEVAGSLLTDVRRYWALEANWKAFADKIQSETRLWSELNSALRALSQWPDARYQLAERPDQPPNLPVVAPVVLEIGSGLIPADTGPEWALIKTYIPEMQQRIQNRMGVTVPGVQIQGSSVLEQANYTIQLDEIPVAWGAVQLGMRFCSAPQEALHELGIEGQDLKDAPDPRTGDAGCWVPPSHWDLVTRTEFELWPEPLNYVIYHLEDVLHQNLGMFLGIQQVDDLLKVWEGSEQASAFIHASLLDRGARLRLAMVLRALVKESVPITHADDILKALQRVDLAHDSIDDIVRAVRLRVRQDLPGNDANAHLVELPEAFYEGVASRRADGLTTIVAPPEQIRELLSELRRHIRSRNTVLVTRDAALRPAVRRLVDQAFPYLMVIAQEELLPRNEALVAGNTGQGENRGVHS